MNKLKVLLIIVGIFALAQNEPTAVSLIIGVGCIAASLFIEYKNYKNEKL